ncbi:MAG: YggS family pyridoxal phosphate-dependent enzyme [Synergistaceae bacterium]|nr:YggS family pyridoxal phosphate-dependent enzyme [Synergistaceae bacterium]
MIVNNIVNVNINENILKIRERIAKAAQRAGRNFEDIKLMAVTKTHELDFIKPAFSKVDLLGENRVQEALNKFKDFKLNLDLHLIGHLQANKARKAVELFNSIDSIDSIEIAERVNKIACVLNKNINILIEVNTSGEVNKTGAEPEKFFEILDKVVSLKNLKLDGLMTVGPISQDEFIIRKSFEMLRNFAERARERTGLELKELSMGMSGDFELAILEGASIVRIGSLIFGERDYR